jgi:hypothetical protein
MNQKWNLQDIRPANQTKRAAKRVATRHHKVAPEDAVEVTSGEDVPIRKETTEQPRRPRAAADMRPRHRQRHTESPHQEEEHFDTIEIVNGNTAKKSKLVISIVVFLMIVTAGVLASAFTGGAEVVVEPRQTEKNIMATFTGSQTARSNAVVYELLTLEADGERQVKAAGQEDVVEQAQGTILIYNEFSTSDVKLIKNTRFESPNGLIYKITESTAVPGYTTNSAGDIIPGVVTADVFAEAPGEEYNIGPSRFTIPGFEGYDEYETVYGETTSAMAGGFSGKKFIIDDSELETSRQSLHTELRDALLQRLQDQKPAGFVLYDNAVAFTFTSLPSVAYGDDLATIKEQAVLRVPIFKEEAFAQFIAEQSVPGYEGLPVRLQDYNALSFSYSAPTTTVSDISVAQELSFELKGDAKIVWEFNENELKADLLGTNKTAISQILGKYPAIETATAEVRPFWKSTFPREMKEIEITEVLE